MFTPGAPDNFDAWQVQQQEKEQQQGNILRRPTMVSRGSQASERLPDSQAMHNIQNTSEYPYWSSSPLSNTSTPPLDASGRMDSTNLPHVQNSLDTPNAQNMPAYFATPSDMIGKQQGSFASASSFAPNNASRSRSTPMPPVSQMAFPPISPIPPISLSMTGSSEEPGATPPKPPLMAPALPSLPAQPPQVMKPPSLKLPSISPPRAATSRGAFGGGEDDPLDDTSYEHAIDFAMQSWDLATGGLKTMTAKRELPTRQDRKSHDLSFDESLERTTRNYTFALVILACVILMLIGCGVVLFVMLQR